MVVKRVEGCWKNLYLNVVVVFGVEGGDERSERCIPAQAALQPVIITFVLVPRFRFRLIESGGPPTVVI